MNESFVLKVFNFILLKVGRCDGVIWLKWSKQALLRQVHYGSKMGQIKLNYAKNEFNDYFQYEDVLVEHFDRKKMLYLVSKLCNKSGFKYFYLAQLSVIALITLLLC